MTQSPTAGGVAEYFKNRFDRIVDVFLMLGYLLGVLSIVVVIVDHLVSPRNADVYSVPQRIVVDRATDADGSEKITISTVLRKNLECSVEAGAGQPRVRFYGPDGRTDISPLFRPSGEIAAGRTQGGAGSQIMVQGYWSPIPPTMKDAHHFVVEVPCQLGADHKFAKVIAKWGPSPMPKENTVIWNGLEQEHLMGKNDLLKRQYIIIRNKQA